MNALRELIQQKLTSITSIDVGVAIPDTLVKEGTTYFSYELEENTLNSDFNNQYFMQVTLTGRLVRKELSSENTLSILDSALEEIKAKLKEINFDYSIREVSQFTDGFKKYAIDGTTRYYEKNKELI